MRGRSFMPGGSGIRPRLAPGVSDGTKLDSPVAKNPWPETLSGVSAPHELSRIYAGGMTVSSSVGSPASGAGTPPAPEHPDAQMFAGGDAKVGTRMGTVYAKRRYHSINMVSFRCATYSSPASPAVGNPAATAWAGAWLRALESGAKG